MKARKPLAKTRSAITLAELAKLNKALVRETDQAKCSEMEKQIMELEIAQ